MSGAGPTVLVMSNAGAARARRSIAALRDAVPETAGAAHHVTEHPDQVLALVGHERWQPHDLLVINGGDGSVQLALSALLGYCPPHRLPRVACLPGGTTNMTAFDLNAHRRFKDCLVTLRQAVQPGERVPPAPRGVVRVRPRGSSPIAARCGLFFGIGTIVQGIEYFHQRLRGRAGRGQLGPGAAMARTLWGIARHQPPFTHPLTVAIEAPGLLAAGDGAGCADAREVSARLLFATTLNRLFLGMRPFWGTGPGGLRATLVERQAPRFTTRLPRLLSGRPDALMAAGNGYHSACIDALNLRFDGAYTLDGELFDNAGDTIEVSATEPVRFLPL